MTHADFNDLETRDYIFKIGDRGKAIQARYDENTDALIFPRAAFDYVYELIKEALSQEPTVQDKQAESEKYQKAFDDGYANGYAQARFDYEQEPCDDAISRKAVKEMIRTEFVDMQDGMSEWRNAVNDVVENILHKAEQLPSVTQKSGKWIINRLIPDKHQCSECGMYIWVSKEEVEEGIKLPNYCSNCGADMRGAE